MFGPGDDPLGIPAGLFCDCMHMMTSLTAQYQIDFKNIGKNGRKRNTVEEVIKRE